MAIFKHMIINTLAPLLPILHVDNKKHLIGLFHVILIRFYTCMALRITLQKLSRQIMDIVAWVGPQTQ